MQFSPGSDGYGYWNRLLNPNAVLQRYSFDSTGTGADLTKITYNYFSFANIFIADPGNNNVREITSDGNIHTIASNLNPSTIGTSVNR